MIKDHPLTGIGLDNFKPLVTRYEGRGGELEKIAHNTYIEIAAEMGIPSLLVFLAILFSVFRTLERVHKHAAHSPFLLTAATGLGGRARWVVWFQSRSFLARIKNSSGS